MAEQIDTQADKTEKPPRILLIKSPQNDPTWRQITHPLGLMSIAAYLRKKYQYDIKIEDMRISRNGSVDLESTIRSYAPDVVGVSALTHESDALPHIAECVKRVNANTPVLLGGPHATAYPEKAIHMSGIDYLVVGEGEITAGRLIERLLDQRDIFNIKGIVYKKDNRIISTGKADFVEDLNDLPMPAYDLIPIKTYGNFDSMSRMGLGNYMSIFSSRGCPFHCVYCHNIFGKVFRCRSAENLFNEIKYLYDTYQIDNFEILDDIFNLDRERLIDFCDRIINSDMTVTFAFPNGLRSDILDETQLSRLRQAGTVFIGFAVETGSPRLQKEIKKNIRLAKIKKNIEIARSLGIHTHGFFMMGFPGETLEEMKMTAEFMVTSKLHTCALFVVVPFEGTELGAINRKMGNIPVSDFTMSYHTKKFVNLTDVPSAQINRMRQNALLKFYLNPSRVFALIRVFPNKRVLGKLIILFFRRLWWRAQ
jgi:radical SAM superfamily enzyme YgiQ (UPF0313 family)